MKKEVNAFKITLFALMASLCALLPTTPVVAVAPYCANGPAFPAVAKTETTPSIGILIIEVEPDFRSLFDNDPGWNVDCTNCWTSPVLEDHATKIFRTAKFFDGGASDVGDVTPPPSFVDGPVGTPEVHTEIKSMILRGDSCPNCGYPPVNIIVKAGVDAGVPASGLYGSRESKGEVERIATFGGDYPAESFFQVFVEVSYSPLILYNKSTDPLLVINHDVNCLPPEVSYIHGETNAVAMYVQDGDLDPSNDVLFGRLRLAGHRPETICPRFDALMAVEVLAGNQDCVPPYSSYCNEVCAFVNEVRKGPIAPCPECNDHEPAAVDNEFTFQGVVDSVHSGPFEGCAPPFDNVQVGDPWSITYCFDPATPDAYAPNIIGDYNQAITSYKLQIGNAIDSAASPAYDYIRVFSNQPPPYDQYEVSISLTNGNNWFMQLDDPTGTAFTNDALKLCGELDLTKFGIKDFSLFGAGGPSNCQVHGTINAETCGTCGACGAAPGACIAPPSGMVSWYPGDDCQPLDQFAVNDGTYAGTPFCPSASKVGGGALGFVSSPPTFITVPDSTSLQFADGDFSIDLWVKTASDGTLVQKGVSQGFVLDLAAGSARFIACGGPSFPVCGIVSSTTIVADDTWHHVTVTVLALDGAQRTMSMYVDGTLQSTSTASVGPLNVSAPMLIGAAGTSGSPTGVLNGALDEIEIFNRLLTAAEISNLFEACNFGKCKCTPPPPAMVAWYTLDELNGSTSYDSALANDGTRTNGPTIVPGKVGPALRFDGSNDHVVVPDDPSLDFGTGNLSIDAWIKTSTTSGVKTIVEKRTFGPTRGYTIFIQNGLLFFQMGDAGGPGDTCGSSPTSPCRNNGSGVNVATGNWVHIAVTVQRNVSNGGRFYVNGNQVATFDPTTKQGSLDNAGAFYIAKHANSSSAYFDGWIDEVELFNSVLTPTDVRRIYRAGVAGKCKPPCPNTPDTDDDGVGDACDNCPNAFNVGQKDSDGDLVGDACDPCPQENPNDADGDGVCCPNDNCCAIANPGQQDSDRDGVGDACDPCPFERTNDQDGDGICCPSDNCCAHANPGQQDADGDGVGDVCDNAPVIANPNQGWVVFQHPIVATSRTLLTWAGPENVVFMQGSFTSAAQIGNYAPSATGTLTGATSLGMTATPAPGSGHYFLVRNTGQTSSWQSLLGMEWGRDTMLP